MTGRLSPLARTLMHRLWPAARLPEAFRPKTRQTEAMRVLTTGGVGYIGSHALLPG